MPNSALTKAAEDLAGQVKAFSREIRINKEVVDRQRKWVKFTVVLGVLNLIGIIVTAAFYVELRHQAVVNCQNNNDFRTAAKGPWKVLVHLNETPEAVKKQTPQMRRLIKEFDIYIDELYAPRDCNDLNKRVEIPDPPKIVEDSGSSDSTVRR